MTRLNLSNYVKMRWSARDETITANWHAAGRRREQKQRAKESEMEKERHVHVHGTVDKVQSQNEIQATKRTTGC